MAPYRKTMYYLKEFDGRGPENLHEIFNYHHSCLRSVVERSFGVLKNEWQILREYHCILWRSNQRLLWHALRCIISQLITTNPKWMWMAWLGMARTVIGQINDQTRNWLAASANDNIVRYWIAAGLYGLAWFVCSGKVCVITNVTQQLMANLFRNWHWLLALQICYFYSLYDMSGICISKHLMYLCCLFVHLRCRLAPFYSMVIAAIF